MLRVQIRDASNSLLMKIEGRFSGDEAKMVETTVARLNTNLDFVIDITDLTFVDSAGDGALRFLKRLGAVFVADNSYSLHICDRLQLPLAVDGRPVRNRRHRNRAETKPFDLASGNLPELDNPDGISNQ